MNLNLKFPKSLIPKSTIDVVPADYSTLSIGQVTRALTKRLPGSSLPNSVTPQNLFLISTRCTQPNLALCQVFLKALISGVFHFFRISLITFMFKIIDYIYCRVISTSCPSTSEMFSGLSPGSLSFPFPLPSKTNFLLQGLSSVSTSGPSGFPISRICRYRSPLAKSSKESAPDLTWSIKSCISFSCLFSDFRFYALSSTRLCNRASVLSDDSRSLLTSQAKYQAALSRLDIAGFFPAPTPLHSTESPSSDSGESGMSGFDTFHLFLGN